MRATGSMYVKFPWQFSRDYKIDVRYYCARTYIFYIDRTAAEVVCIFITRHRKVRKTKRRDIDEVFYLNEKRSLADVLPCLKYLRL